MKKTPKASFMLDADLLTLRALIAVVDDGGFSAAAKRIGRTQSAVSLQIAKLEERMQVRLLERTSRSVEQTPAGETFIAYARRIVQLADEGLAAVAAPEVVEPLRIGFAEYLVPQHLHLILSRLKQVHPKSGMELRLGSGFELYHALTRHELDVVVAGPESASGMPLLNEALVWVGPKSFDPEHKVESIPLILMQPPCSYRKAAFDALTGSDTAWHVALNANSVQAVQAAVAAGLGISAMPRTAVSHHLKILNSGLPTLPETSIHAFWDTQNPHPLTKRFIACIEDELTSLKVA